LRVSSWGFRGPRGGTVAVVGELKNAVARPWSGNKGATTIIQIRGTVSGGRGDHPMVADVQWGVRRLGADRKNPGVLDLGPAAHQISRWFGCTELHAFTSDLEGGPVLGRVSRGHVDFMLSDTPLILLARGEAKQKPNPYRRPTSARLAPGAKNDR